jgi:hypothetical protein
MKKLTATQEDWNKRMEKIFFEQEGIKNMAITEHLEEESKANNFANEKGAN